VKPGNQSQQRAGVPRNRKDAGASYPDRPLSPGINSEGMTMTCEKCEYFRYGIGQDSYIDACYADPTPVRLHRIVPCRHFKARDAAELAPAPAPTRRRVEVEGYMTGEGMVRLASAFEWEDSDDIQNRHLFICYTISEKPTDIRTRKVRVTLEEV